MKLDRIADGEGRSAMGPRSPAPSAGSRRDRDLLRGLLERKRDAAADPGQAVRRAEWARLNDLGSGRPLVWINEIPWDELDGDGELTPQCSDPWLRTWETQLRRELYQWRHMPADMVVDPVVLVPTVCSPVSTYADFGIEERTVTRDGARDVQFEPVLRTDADLERLRIPDVRVDRGETDRRFARASEISDGILPVFVQGIVTQWFAPWDTMVRWYGIEPLLLDLYDRPEFVHRLLDRFTAAMCAVLDRQEHMGLLDISDGNFRVGSGGLGYTAALPGPDRRPVRVRPAHQWGCGNAQIFSEVSPEMHEEFSLQYEARWIRRFGLAYYGCCEPLHRKIGLLRRVLPNLRKVSISPWADAGAAAEAAEGRLALSLKPNPAVFASDGFNPEAARRELVERLDACRGAPVEIIMKDITTVRGDPRRLWAWSRLAVETAARYG